MFYYEAWDPESKNWQLWTALKYELCTVIVVGTTLLLMFLFLGYADVPMDEYSYNMTLLPDDANANCYSTPCGGPPREVHLRISVTPAVYLVALVAFVGWFLFTIFVGVGLIVVAERAEFCRLPLEHFCNPSACVDPACEECCQECPS